MVVIVESTPNITVKDDAKGEGNYHFVPQLICTAIETSY
jgi:hypothetical protein